MTEYRKQRLKLAKGTYHLFRPDDGQPILGLVPNRKGTYVTLCRLHYENRLMSLEIPKGFRTDLASIPWWLKWLPFLDPTDPKYRMAVIHDAMYAMQEVYREDADMVFRSGLKADGVGIWIRMAMYYGVRLGGRKAWMDHARRKAARGNPPSK